MTITHANSLTQVQRVVFWPWNNKTVFQNISKKRTNKHKSAFTLDGKPHEIMYQPNKMLLSASKCEIMVHTTTISHYCVYKVFYYYYCHYYRHHIFFMKKRRKNKFNRIKRWFFPQKCQQQERTPHGNEEAFFHKQKDCVFKPSYYSKSLLLRSVFFCLSSICFE